MGLWPARRVGARDRQIAESVRWIAGESLFSGAAAGVSMIRILESGATLDAEQRRESIDGSPTPYLVQQR